MGKRAVDCVPYRLEDGATVALNCCCQQVVVPPDGSAIGNRTRLKELNGFFTISEREVTTPLGNALAGGAFSRGLACATPAQRKREYVLSFWGLVDLVAIIPTYVALLAFFLPVNVTAIKVVRMMRVLRILRTLKLAKLASDRAQESMQRRGSTFALDIQIYFIALFTAVVISSTVVYFMESDIPDTKFVDIPAAMWWSIVTITTTGYGDMVPATFAGRMVAGLTMIVGLTLFGILTSVIGRSMLSSLFGVEEGEEPAAESAGATDA